MKNLRLSCVLIKPHEPRADIDRHVYAERCELEALTFLRSWCRASKRQAVQRRANDAEELEGAPVQQERSPSAAVA